MTNTMLNEGEAVSRGAMGRQRNPNFSLPIDGAQAQQLMQDLGDEPSMLDEARLDLLESYAGEVRNQKARDMRSMYTDPVTWWKGEGNDNVADEVKHEIANRRFIANAFGQTTDQQGDLYPSFRDRYFDQTFGKVPANESEAFTMLQKGVTAQQQTEQAIKELPSTLALNLMRAAAGGTEVSEAASYDIYQSWKDRHADVLASLPEDWESKAMEQAETLRSEMDTMMRDIAPEAKKVWDILQKWTRPEKTYTGDKPPQGQGRGPSQQDTSVANDTPVSREDVEGVAKALTEMPEEKQKRLLEMLYMSAEATGAGMGRGFFEKIGEGLVRGGVRIYEEGVMASEDRTARYNLTRLKRGETLYEMADGVVGTKEEIARLASSGNYNATKLLTDPSFQAGTGNVNDERRSQLLDANEQRLRELSTLRKIRGLAEGGIDPLKTEMTGIAGSVIQGAYDYSQSAAYTVMAAVPFVGFPAVAVSLANTNYLRMLDEYPDIDPDFAWNASLAIGAPQAFIERFKVNALMGRSPMLNKLMKRMTDARVPLGVRIGLAYGANVAYQTGQEFLQEAMPTVADQLSAALREDMPEFDANQAWGAYVDQMPQIFYSMLWAGLIGTGAVSLREFKRDGIFLTNVGELEMVGIVGDTARDIAAEQDTDARNEKIKTAWGQRSEADIKAGIAKRAAMLQAANVNDTRAGMPQRDSVELQDGTVQHTIRDSEGNVLLKTTDPLAADVAYIGMVRQITSKEFNNETVQLKGLTEWWLTADPTRADNEQRQLRDTDQGNAQQKLEALQQANNEQGIAELHRRIAQSPYAGTPYDQIQILGEASVEQVGDMVFRSVIALNKNSRVRDAREEMHHTAVRMAVANGKVDEQTMRGWLEATERVFAEKGLNTLLPRADMTDIVESMAVVQEAFENERISADVEMSLPQAFVDYIKRMIQVLVEVLKRGKAIREALDAGVLPAELEGFLAMTTGVSQQEIVDRARERTEQDMRGTDGLTDEERRALQIALQEDMEQDAFDALRKNGTDILDAVREAGGLPSAKSSKVYQYAGELKRIREAQKGGNAIGVKATFNLFRKDAPDLDALIKDLQSYGFSQIQTPSDLFDMIERRMSTGRPIYGYEAASMAALVENYSIGSRAQPDVERNVITLPDVTISGPSNYSIEAWHASPHKYDKVSLSKAGTGEGAAVYGWGFYMAENPSVSGDGGSYQLQFQQDFDTGRRSRITINGKAVNASNLAEFIDDISDQTYNTLVEYFMAQRSQDFVRYTDRVKKEDWDAAFKEGVTLNEPQIYRVEVDADQKEFLDWDQPFADQSEFVQNALRDVIGTKTINYTNEQSGLKTSVERVFVQGNEEEGATEGAGIYRGIARLYKQREPRGLEREVGASMMLKERGIKGIRYLDQGSRGRSEWIAKHTQGGENTFPNEKSAREFVERNPEYALIAPSQFYNYVIFDDSLIKILTRNGEQISVEQAAEETANDSTAPEVGAFPEASENYSIGLVSLHKLSEEKLRFADRMGGLAVPSIAVTKVGTAIQGFGEITLVAGQELGDPSLNPVYDADAYTSRFPKPEYKKVKSSIAQKLVNFFRSFDERYASHYSDSVKGVVWDNAVNTPNPDETINKLTRSNVAKGAYLSSVEGVDVEPVMRPKSERWGLTGTKAMQAYIADAPDIVSIDYDDVAARKKLTDAVLAATEEKIADKSPEVQQIMRDGMAANIEEDTGLLMFGRMSIVREDMKNYGQTEVDAEATGVALDAAMEGREAAFVSWVESTIRDMYAPPRIKVAGKWQPYTLENIARVMTAGRIAGVEKTMAFGEGPARAAAARRFGSLNELRNAAEGLATEAEVETARTTSREVVGKWREEVIAFYKWDSTWDALDNAMQAIARFYKAGDMTERGMQRALRSLDFVDVPSELATRGISAARALMNTPVPYFESKPQRVVRLNEFKAAIVPKSVSVEAVNILTDHGLEVVSVETSSDVTSPELQAALKSVSQDISYSISTQSEIDRVQKAMGALDRSPLDTLEITEKLRKRFASIMAENMVELAAMRQGGVAEREVLDEEGNPIGPQPDAPRTKASGAEIRRTKLLQALGELDGLLSALPPQVAAKVGGYTVLANIGTGDRALSNFFIKRLEMIDKELERYLKDRYTKALDELFKRAKPKQDAAGKVPQGKLGASVHDLFDELRKATTKTVVEVDGEVTSLEQQVASGELEPDMEAMKGLLADVLPLFANWATADASRMAQAVQIGFDILRKAYKRQRELTQIKRNQQEERRLAAKESTGITGDIDEAINKQQNIAGKRWQQWKALNVNLFGFDQLISFVFGRDSKITKEIVNAQRKADNVKADELIGVWEEWQGVLAELAGVEDSRSMKATHKGQDIVYRLAEPKTAKIKHANMQGEEIELEFSQNQLITITMMWMQPKGRAHMMGKLDSDGNPIGDWHYDQDFVNRVEAKMTPEARAIRRFLLRKYAEEWSSINEVFVRLRGINMPQEDFYSPLGVDPLVAIDSGMLADPATGFALSAPNRTPPALRSRGAAVAKPKFQDAVQVYFAHRKQMAHWKAYAEFNSDMLSVLGHRNTRNAVEAKGGVEALKTLNKWLTYMTQGGNIDAAAGLAMNEYFNGVMGRIASFVLFGKVVTVAIQSTQLGAAAAKMPFPSYINRLAKLLTGQMSWGDSLRSPYIQRRIKEMPPQVQLAMEGLLANKPSYVAEAARRVGWYISGSDGLYTAGTYAMIYDYRLEQAKKAGLSGPEAERVAREEAERDTDEVAQPTRMGARSAFEATMTSPLARSAWAFGSDARKNWAMNSFLWFSNASADRKRQALYFTLVISTAMATVIRTIARDIKDDDDEEWFDEKNWDVRRMALMMATDFVYGFPVLGEMAEETAFRLFGEYRPQGSILSVGDSPAALSRMPQHIADTLNGEADTDKIVKDVNRMLQGMGLFAPQAASAAALSNAAKDLYEFTKPLWKNDE